MLQNILMCKYMFFLEKRDEEINNNIIHIFTFK